MQKLFKITARHHGEDERKPIYFIAKSIAEVKYIIEWNDMGDAIWEDIAEYLEGKRRPVVVKSLEQVAEEDRDQVVYHNLKDYDWEFYLCWFFDPAIIIKNRLGVFK